MIPRKNERGQALILIVLAIVGLIGLTALAVDGGVAYSDRRQSQNAADASALAAALAKSRDQDLTSAAYVRAASNNFNNDGTTNVVTVHNPPASGPYQNIPGSDCYADSTCDQYIQVIITSHVDTYFGPVIGFDSVENKVQAVARVIPPTPQVMYNGDAVVGLAPTGCDNVNIAGNGQIQTWGGGLFSNSTDNCGMTFQGSSQTQTHEGSGGINMVGGAYQKIGNPSIQDHGEGFHYNLPQYPYPPTDLPNPICTGDSSWTGNVMSPGNYTGTFPPAGVTTLQSGVYCIYGDFNMNGNDHLTGHEVVLVMETGALHWNGNAVVTDLTAPTSGPFQGLLMFAPLSNTNTMIFNGTADVSLSGTTLFPAAEIKINGAHVQFQKKSSQLIGYRVEISGGSDIQIEINHSSLYQPDTDPIIQLVQ